MNDPSHSLSFIPGQAPLSGWDGEWRPDPESVSRLARLEAGTAITIVKRAPDGVDVTRYPATVRRNEVPPPWIEVEATWTHRAVTVGGLAFEPGDSVREFFSAVHPYNAFALYSPLGAFKGWYGNVTFPAFLIGGKADPTLVWHDLYLDVVILPDGSTSLLDDDELAASGVPRATPLLGRAIEDARQMLIHTLPHLLLF